jgi:hypothetical protein
MRRFKTTKRTTYCFAWTEDDEEVTRSKNYYEFEELSAETVKTVVLDLLVGLHQRPYRIRIVQVSGHG